MSHCSICSENYNKIKQLPQSWIPLAAHSLVSSLQHKAGIEVTHLFFWERTNAADRVLMPARRPVESWAPIPSHPIPSHPIPSHPIPSHPILPTYWKFAVSSCHSQGSRFESIFFSWSRMSYGSQPSFVWLTTGNVHKPSNNSWVQKKTQWVPCSWDSTSPLSFIPQQL